MSNLSLKTIGGAALVLAGAGAMTSLTAVRLVPFTALTTGLVILASNVFKPPLRVAPPTSLTEKITHIREDKKASRKLLTSLLITLAIAIPLFYLVKWAGATPQDNLLLDKADSNRVMATDIPHCEDIRGLEKINGVAISIIENRARPGHYSRSGFLGKEESLRVVLYNDCKTVEALGTTHRELAEHLEAIWKRASDYGDISAKFPLLYDATRVENSTIGNGAKIQLLQASTLTPCGAQSDIFNQTPDQGQYDVYGSHAKGNAWASSLDLKNLANGESLLVGYGVIDYIRKYGFYEGGEPYNGYRIDPIRLVSILTGNSYCSIAQAIGRVCK